jgi:hypothetical protein
MTVGGALSRLITSQLLFVAIVLFPGSDLRAEELIGQASVVDGDTLEMQELEVQRLGSTDDRRDILSSVLVVGSPTPKLQSFRFFGESPADRVQDEHLRTRADHD